MEFGQLQRLAINDIISVIRKYKFSIFISSLSLVGLISYNHYAFELENEVYNLNKQKSILISENFQLKRSVSELSNPERINSVARKQLNMVNVRYEQVKFIHIK